MNYHRKSPLGVPEINIVIFGFLLNFVWEILQVPLFAEMKEKQHWDGVRVCTIATFGDIAILLIAYWLVASFRGRDWIVKTKGRAVTSFVGISLVLSVLIEVVMTRYLHHYSYAPNMPIIPGIGVGLSPFLQWLTLPPLLLWFVHRQLR